MVFEEYEWMDGEQAKVRVCSFPGKPSAGTPSFVSRSSHHSARNPPEMVGFLVLASEGERVEYYFDRDEGLRAAGLDE